MDNPSSHDFSLLQSAAGWEQMMMADPMMMGEENQGPVAYYKLMVYFQITGSFTNYLKFRNVIANKSKIVNIEKEKIDTSQDTPGQIIAAATVSLVKAAD